MGTLRELYIKFDLLWWGKRRDLDLWCPNSRGKCGDFTSGKASGDWEQIVSCSRSIDEKIAGENEKVCQFKSIGHFFFVHEIVHRTNISINRTVEQLAENSAKKKEQFKDLK